MPHFYLATRKNIKLWDQGVFSSIYCHITQWRALYSVMYFKKLIVNDISHPNIVPLKILDPGFVEMSKNIKENIWYYTYQELHYAIEKAKCITKSYALN